MLLKLIYAQLERRYGHLLVGHVAGYITSSKSGLTESEIEDLLCLDDRVLGEVFAYQACLKLNFMNFMIEHECQCVGAPLRDTLPFQISYRTFHPVICYVLEIWLWGIPPAGGLLL